MMSVLLTILLGLWQSPPSVGVAPAHPAEASGQKELESLQTAAERLSRSSNREIKEIAGAVRREVDTLQSEFRGLALPVEYVQSLADDAGGIVNLSGQSELNPSAMQLLKDVAKDLELKASLIRMTVPRSTDAEHRLTSPAPPVRTPETPAKTVPTLPAPPAPRKSLPTPGGGGRLWSYPYPEAQMALPTHAVDAPSRPGTAVSRLDRFHDHELRRTHSYPSNLPVPSPPAKFAPAPRAPAKIAPAPQAPAKVAPAPQAPTWMAPAPVAPARVIAVGLNVEIVTVDSHDKEIENVTVYFTGFEFLTRFTTQGDRIAARYFRKLGTSKISRFLPPGVYYLLAVSGELPREINTNDLQPESIGPGRSSTIKLLAK